MLERRPNLYPMPAGSSAVAVIGTLATFIGAIVGLLGVLHTLGWIGTKSQQPTPAVIFVPSGPSATEMAEIQMQLRVLQTQIARTSIKAAEISNTDARAASIAAATSQLTKAKESAVLVETRLSQLQSPSTQINPEERNAEFEVIKNEIDKLSKMQSSLTSVLDAMNEQAMGAIRHMKE